MVVFMLNFDPVQYLSVEQGAADLADAIDEAIGREFDTGLRNVAFWGVGGVAFLNMPAARLLQTSSPFPTYVDMGAEAILTDNVNVGPGTLVVFTSVSGTTKEAITALEYAKKKGARILTLVGTPGTPLAKLADISFYNRCADPTSSENFYLQTLFVALSILRRTTQFPQYQRVVAELKTLPRLLVGVKEQFEPRAAAFAAEIRDEQHHIITGAGNTWPEAWYYGMCILEEMQWIRTRPVHASDFFHGTLELVEKGRQRHPVQGRGRYPAPGAARGTLCVDRVEEGAGVRFPRLRSSRPVAGRARSGEPHRVRRRLRTAELAHREGQGSRPDHTPLLQEG
jgi:fructoselysine-6-phosphate deglycase